MGKNCIKNRQMLWIVLCSSLLALYGCRAGKEPDETAESVIELSIIGSETKETEHSGNHSTESQEETAVQEGLSDSADIWEQMAGKWHIDFGRTEQLWGTGISYGDAMEITDAGAFSYYIGIGVGGTGQCVYDDGAVTVEVEPYAESAAEQEVLTFRYVSDEQGEYILMKWYDEDVYWVRDAASGYGAVIEAARACVVSGEPSDEFDFSSVLHQGWEYEVLGYLIEDIDGDGVDELLIGENGSEPGSTWDGIIYDVYTISGGELVHVLDGWERNRYYLCENGMIANEGSSGAGDSVDAYYTFDGTGIQLMEAVIYAGYIDADNPWFYSTSSDHDTEQAEPISEERAEEIMGQYQYRHPQFIPFV